MGKQDKADDMITKQLMYHGHPIHWNPKGNRK